MSLHGRYDSDNVFAKIMRGEIPAAKVTETNDVLVIMDAFPQTRGHCLVIPKAQSRNLLEMNAKDVGRVFGMVQRVAKAVKTALKPDGIVVTQFNGSEAGQTVFHTHAHIIPRYAKSDMAEHSSGKMADAAELADLAQQIKNALDQ